MIRPQPHYRVKDKCEATNWKQNSQNLVRNLYLYRIRQLQDAAASKRNTIETKLVHQQFGFRLSNLQSKHFVRRP